MERTEIPDATSAAGPRHFLSGTCVVQRSHDRLSAYALFSGLLAAAGLPIYIHAPKFYVDEYGVSLAALGATLFGLRLLDVVQDPILGWISERLRNRRSLLVVIGAAIISLSMFGLFVALPPLPPLLWFALMLTGVFSAFSLLSINFYAQGVEKADRLETGSHLRLARWRETGALIGICLAAISPALLAPIMNNPFAGFAAGFAVVTFLAVLAMRKEWGTVSPIASSGFGVILKDYEARSLLIIALLNAAPVAVTSTLFLFFVESRLQATGWEGPLLVLFFLSAAVASPIWSLCAEKWGTVRVLILAMIIGLGAFAFAIPLREGDTLIFAIICVVSGAALGADLTLLPAMFAKRMAKIAPSGTEGFGLWSFVSKFALAFAAVTLLPILEIFGFRVGSENSQDALFVLSLLYAGLPCVLKVLAIMVILIARPGE